MFQIEQNTKQCSKLALTQAWDPFDIPLNSTYEDQYFIGGPGDMIEVQEWSDRKPARQSKYSFRCLELYSINTIATLTLNASGAFQTLSKSVNIFSN